MKPIAEPGTPRIRVSLAERLRVELNNARRFSEHLFEGFLTTEHWMHQVHHRAYHPLWVAGHIGLMENSSILLLDPSKALDRPVFREKFRVGTHPTNNAADYPPLDEVLEFMRERRATLLGILEALDEEELDRPMPPGTPDYLSDVGSVFSAAAWHEGMHSGQMNVAFRALERDLRHGTPPRE